MDKIEEMLSNNQELTGAYKDFYEHELTESALMKQGYGYDDAHNMALDIHDVVPQALYSPEVVEVRLWKICERNLFLSATINVPPRPARKSWMQ